MPYLNHTQNIIEIQHVSFAYDKERILKDITMNIHQGDFLGIIGPNGGGKTTLLKIILGLLQPQNGTVKLFGQRLDDFKDWSKIGYVPQKAAYFDPNFPITVAETVAMGRYAKVGLFRFPGKLDQDKAQAALEQVDMGAFANRLLGDLSGGEQQRVFIARALASEPEVIFLDEPTAGVDIKTQEKFYLLLEKLNKKIALTLVLVSHDIDVVANEATEVACLNKTLVYHGSPKEFIKGDYLTKVYGKEVKFILHV